MFGAADPNLIVGGLAVAGLLVAAFWRLIVWVRDAPVRPDPWDAKVQAQMEVAPEACPNCSTPQSLGAWFCPHCGRAVGPYNNMMPFIQIFSEGEVFRNAASGQSRKRPLILIGYLLLSLSLLSFFAPIIWISLLWNYRRSDTKQENVSE